MSLILEVISQVSLDRQRAYGVSHRIKEGKVFNKGTRLFVEKNSDEVRQKVRYLSKYRSYEESVYMLSVTFLVNFFEKNMFRSTFVDLCVA